MSKPGAPEYTCWLARSSEVLDSFDSLSLSYIALLPPGSLSKMGTLRPTEDTFSSPDESFELPTADLRALVWTSPELLRPRPLFKVIWLRWF